MIELKIKEKKVSVLSLDSFPCALFLCPLRNGYWNNGIHKWEEGINATQVLASEWAVRIQVLKMIGVGIESQR